MPLKDWRGKVQGTFEVDAAEHDSSEREHTPHMIVSRNRNCQEIISYIGKQSYKTVGHQCYNQCHCSKQQLLVAMDSTTSGYNDSDNSEDR